MPVFLFFEGFCNILHQNADPEVLRALLFTAITVDAVIGTFVLTLILCTNRFDAFRRCPVVKRKQTRDVDFYHARHTALTTGAANQKFCSIFLHREIPPFFAFPFFYYSTFPVLEQG